MANTMTLIASSTVGSGGTSTITFSSIPQTYTDLCIKISLRSAATGVADNIALNINGTGISTSVSSKNVRGNGAAASSNINETMVYTGNGATASVFGNGEIYIPNYTSSSAYKSMSADTVSENNATTSFTFLDAILWSNNSAITSIALTNTSSVNWLEYSTAYLYGIKNS